MYLRESRHQVRAKVGLERRDSRVVDKAQHDFAHIERLTNVRVYQVQEILGIVSWRCWRVDRHGGRRSLLRKYGHPFSGFTDGVESGSVNFMQRNTINGWTYSSTAI